MIDHSVQADGRSIHCFGFHLKLLSLIFLICVGFYFILQSTSYYSQPASVQRSKAVAVFVDLATSINLTCPSLIPSFTLHSFCFSPFFFESHLITSFRLNNLLYHQFRPGSSEVFLSKALLQSRSYSKSPLSSDQQRLVPSATHSSTSTLKWLSRSSYLHFSQNLKLNEHLSHFTFHSISIKPFPSTTTQATLLFSFHSEHQQSLLILLSSFIQKYVNTSRLLQFSSSYFHCFKLNLF